MRWKEPLFLKKGHPFTPWMVLFNISLATLLAIVSATATGVASSTISGELIIDTSSTLWIFTAYLMAVGSSLPLSGWLAERFGYKYALFLGLLIFIIGSVGVGFAFDFSSLIFFRIVEGVGGGIIFPISITILSIEFPKELVATAISLYMSVGFGIGLVVGFLAGGYYGQLANWRWLFYDNIFIGAVALFLIWGFHSETERKDVSFDFLGYILFLIFLLPLLILVNSVKQPWNTEGWTSNLILGCAALSLLGFISMIITELRVKNPVIILHLFKELRFSLCCLAIALMGIIFFSTVSLFPAYLEEQLAYQKMNVAYMMLPLGITFGIVGTFGGVLTEWIGTRALCLIGLLVLTVSCFMNMSITLYSDPFQIGLILFVRGIGVGLSLGPVTVLGITGLSKEVVGNGTVLLTFSRQIGGAFGSSVMGLILATREPFHAEVFGASVDPYSPAFQKVVHHLSTTLRALKGSTGEEAFLQAKAFVMKDALMQAKIASMNDAYFVIGCLTALLGLLIAGLMLRSYLRSRQEPGTSH